MKKKRFLSLLLTIVMLVSTLAMSGCGTQNQSANGNYDGELVYDHSMELQYAKLFSVDYYKGGYKLITITNRDEDTAIVSKQSKLLLVPDGMSAPSGVDSDTVILKTPVTNMLVSSTPVTSLMNASNCLDNISQVTYDKKSWYIDAVKKAFDDGKLTYVGDYKAPDYETIIAGAPTLAIFSTMLTSVPDVAEKLKELGINYILDQSTYEDHPLGRVEWAKLYAALCNEEDAATDMFNAQAAYVDTLSKAEKTGKSVAVFYITSKGKLYVRNAGDYLAQMVNIAGGDYIFSDLNADKTGTQEMGIESFYEKAKDADYIIYVWNLGGKPSTLNDFTGYNSILADEMGLGKTVQSTMFMNMIIQGYKISPPFLVVAPLSTLPHWESEVRRWTNMHVVVLHGSVESRENILRYEWKSKQGEFDVLLTTYEIAIVESVLLSSVNWAGVVVDEAHRLKGRNNKLGDVLRKMEFGCKLLLTGTPLQVSVLK